MRASATEGLAAALIGLTLVNLTVVEINRPAWIALAKALSAKPAVTSTASYLLAGRVLSVLVQSGLTIAQVLTE